MDVLECLDLTFFQSLLPVKNAQNGAFVCTTPIMDFSPPTGIFFFPFLFPYKLKQSSL